MAELLTACISSEICNEYSGQAFSSQSVPESTAEKFRSWYLDEVSSISTFKEIMMKMMQSVCQDMIESVNIDNISTPDVKMPDESKLDIGEYNFNPELSAPFYLHCGGYTKKINSPFSVGRTVDYADFPLYLTDISRFHFFCLPTTLISKKDGSKIPVFILIDLTSKFGTKVFINGQNYSSTMEKREYIIFKQDPSVDVEIYVSEFKIILNGKSNRAGSKE